MLKDGYSFFKDRQGELKDRFRKTDFHTTILILHPDYQYIPAVAQMDPVKANDPAKQIEDCRLAIQTMQKIRRELMAELPAQSDICDRVKFFGYKLVPTWTGFIGSSLAYISLYFTHPHRGGLNTLIVRRMDGKEQQTSYYDSMSIDYNEILREVPDQQGAGLFEYKPPIDTPG